MDGARVHQERTDDLSRVEMQSGARFVGFAQLDQLAHRRSDFRSERRFQVVGSHGCRHSSPSLRSSNRVSPQATRPATCRYTDWRQFGPTCLNSTRTEFDREFDYIVIGAGTAGCVIATRLSEDPANRVCLIEAGGSNRHPFIEIPAAVGAAIMSPTFGWGLTT